MEKTVRAPIVIEGAMECEMSVVLNALTDTRTTVLCGYPLTEGKLNGYPVLAALNNVGMINAACLTALLIERYNPLCIISQGTAGSHTAGLRTGDIVIGKTVRNVNCINMRPADCRRLEEISSGMWREKTAYASDRHLTDIALSVPYEYGAVREGTVASCDFWSYSPERIREIQERFGSDCEEMETFAAAQVCDRMRVPFLSIRVISNNELNGESFSAEAAIRCQKYVLDIAGKIAAEL